MRLIAALVVVGFSHAAFCVSPVSAQGADPFGKAGFPGNPFEKRAPLEGVPVNIVLSVVDHKNSPVSNAVISVRNSDSRNSARTVRYLDVLRTNAKGLAIWRTSDQRLAEYAGLNRGMVLFRVASPLDRRVPRISRGYKLEEINKSRYLKFKGRDGVSVRGKVIGKTDRRPVEDAHIRVTKKDAPNANVVTWFTTTDPLGNWSIVVPRANSLQVVCSGQVEGYDLERVQEYQTIAEVAGQVTEITVPAFEIKQLLPLSGRVLDENGKAVPGALVASTYGRWLTKDFLRFVPLGSSTKSNSNGDFTFNTNRANWEEGFVRVEATIDGVRCGGRVIITEPVNEALEIHLRPLTQVSGKLLDGEEPIAGTNLLIFEEIQVPNKPQGWVFVGVRGEVKTENNGAFEFFVERGVRFLIAAQDESGRIVMRHRLPEKMGAEAVVVDLNLQSAK